MSRGSARPGPSRWVWNKGIAALCDRRIPDEFPQGLYVHRLLPPAAPLRAPLPARAAQMLEPGGCFYGLTEGELVWLRGDCLAAFVSEVLPLLRVPLVLVTGDCDASFPSALGGLACRIVDSPMIVHWYTQNHDGCGPPKRVSGIPIGLDLHTLSQGPAWGEPQTTPAQQELDLADVAASLPALSQRIPQVYVDFAWQARWEPAPPGARLPWSRQEIVDRLRSNPLVVLQEEPLPRLEMWRRKGQFAFSLSPHGNGLDCHRTWESLLLGQVVLVPSSSLDPLFEGTRAIKLQTWEDISLPNLERWLALSAEAPVREAPLTNAYWVNRMRVCYA